MTHDDILDFWFVQLGKARWFAKSDETDRLVAERLGPVHSELARMVPASYLESARGFLAAILVLDQVPRNVHRGTPEAFASDPDALALARKAVDEGLDADLSTDERVFLYLPFEHSENLADQERSVALFTALGDANYLDYAVRHRDVISRFGRFPHRNAIVGRASTPAEEAYLAEPGSGF